MSGNLPLKVFLCGDVMIGRGIDQILSHPVDPRIYEPYVKDARDYLSLAEEANGAIPTKVGGAYIWGDALKELEFRLPHIKLINLETCITTSNTPCIQKGIQYRMHPENIDAIKAAQIDVCALANNHVLDWGVEGLGETLDTLNKNNIAYAGAGKNIEEATAPTILTPPGISGRVLIFSMGINSSGIPDDWSATTTQPGVWLLEDLSSNTIKTIIEKIESYKRPDDFCIISIHWGANWVYQIPEQHQTFAHQLIDSEMVHLIHGHSSHHPIGVELYKEVPILYGCGDLINDYEGIADQIEFKSNLSLMYFLYFNNDSLRLERFELVPFEIRKFKLNTVGHKEALWLLSTLEKKSTVFNTHFKLENSIIRICL